MSRRHGLLAVAVLLAWPGGAHPADAPSVAGLERRYGLQVLTRDLQATVAPAVDTPARPVRMADLPPGSEPAALRSLDAAMAVYPPGFLHRMLRRVAMAGDLTVFGEEAGGLFGGAMVTVSYRYVGDPGSDGFDTDTFHHELSSVVRAQVAFNVTTWSAANPPGFAYMDLAAYKATLADAGSVDGDPALHAAGFVARYGQTSLDNDFNTYAEKVFGHGPDFAREIAAFPRMRRKTRQLMDIYEALDPGFADYFRRTGLDAAAGP